MTRVHMWDHVWRSIERMGIPADSLAARRWDDSHSDNGQAPLATMLLNHLDALSRSNLTRDAVENIGEAIMLAFEMGRRND